MDMEPPLVDPESRRSDGSATPPESRVWQDGGAFSVNTGRARRCDLAIQTAWCAGRGLRALPAEPAALAALVDAVAEDRLRCAAMSPASPRPSRPDGGSESGKSETVRLAIRRKDRLQDEARDLNGPRRNLLLAAAGGRRIDDRNRALRAVACDTRLRRVELVSLQVADLLAASGGDSTRPVPPLEDRPGGRGRDRLAGAGQQEDGRGMARPNRHRGRSLFLPLAKGGADRRSAAGQVPHVFKAMARKAGLPAAAADMSGHSTRVGEPLDMIATGIELPANLQAGRWKSADMVNRHGKPLRARKSGAALSARLQGRA